MPLTTTSGYFVSFILLFAAGLLASIPIDISGTRQANVTAVTAPAGPATVTRQVQPSILVLTKNRDQLGDRPLGDVRIIRSQWFSALGLGIVEVAVPTDDQTSMQIGRIAEAFPSSEVAMNQPVLPLGTFLSEDFEPARGRDHTTDCRTNERIGVIDGSIAADLEKFKRHAILRRSFVPDFSEKSNSDHSTGVVSVLIDTYARGSSQPLNILVGEILEDRNGRTAGSLLSVIKALDWLVGERVAVVNMSFQTQENAVFSSVLDSVAETGTIMVAAAGNHTFDFARNFPAAHSEVLAVTAIDRFEKSAPYANRADYIDFAAPGVNVPVTTASGNGHVSGTSYAAPYVTGVVMLALAGGAPRNVAAIEQMLAKDAIDLGAPGKDDVYGWGLPRVETACRRQRFSHR